MTRKTEGKKEFRTRETSLKCGVSVIGDWKSMLFAESEELRQVLLSLRERVRRPKISI